jgi:hypothetical protein
MTAHDARNARLLENIAGTMLHGKTLWRPCASACRPAIEHLPPAIAIERVSQAIGFMVRVLADQARLIDTDTPPREPLAIDAFTTNLVDVLVAMLTAPTAA